MQDMFKSLDDSRSDDAQNRVTPSLYPHDQAGGPIAQQAVPLARPHQGMHVEESATHADSLDAPIPSKQELVDTPKAAANEWSSRKSLDQRFQPVHESPAYKTARIGKTPTFHISFVQHLLQRRSPRFNLIIATLCVLSGAMLLVVVFIMSLGLSSPSSPTAIQSAQQMPLAPAPDAAHLTPSPSTILTAQPVLSPTAGYAGQPYIDNAQMTSAVNFSTAQPLQLTTQFYRNQKIYVTFALHPGRSGAACLLWYLNNQEFTTYTFPVDNVSISAYSYAISGIPGPGYVEIYWASSTTCEDKVLAQKVSFTVS